MNKGNEAFAFFLVAWFGLACSGSGLQLSRPGTGGRDGSAASGGVLGSGGTGAGGVAAGGGAAGNQNSGGSAAGGAAGRTSDTGGRPASGGHGGADAGGGAAGGTIGTGGGTASSGGRGGTNAGGSPSGGTSGTGGTTCFAVKCDIACPFGEIPNPDPCRCPTCASADAGVGKDAAPDAQCLALPCAYPLCAVGYTIVTPPCGCPTCVPVDAGARDATICPLVACPDIKCAGGTVPNPDPCGCPMCAPADAAAETSKLDCVDLDECTCRLTNGCTAIAEPCYCPFPYCDPSGACVCGGGQFTGCASVTLATCSSAKARVAALCPQLSGPTFDTLCQPESVCVTKCLNDVSTCNDVFCTFCEVCDCMTDRFSTCVGKCNSSRGQ